MKAEHTRIALQWAWYRFKAWGPILHGRAVVRAMVQDFRADPVTQDERAREDVTVCHQQAER